MFQFNSKASLLPFYTNINNQLRFQNFAYKDGVLIGVNKTIQFQLQLPKIINLGNVNAEVYTSNDVLVSNISSSLRYKIGVYYNWISNSISDELVSSLVSDDGLYYVKITTSGGIYYSDLFRLINEDSESCYGVLSWSNSCDMMNTIYNGFTPTYSTYYNQISVNGSIEKGTPIIENEEIQNGLGETKIIKSLIKDTWTLSWLIPTNSIDAFQLLQLHSTIQFNPTYLESYTNVNIRLVSFDDTESPILKLVTIVLETYSDAKTGCCTMVADSSFAAPIATNKSTSAQTLSANGTTTYDVNLLNGLSGTGIKLQSIGFVTSGHSAAVLDGGYTGRFTYTRPAGVITNIVATYTIVDILNRTSTANLTFVPTP